MESLEPPQSASTPDSGSESWSLSNLHVYTSCFDRVHGLYLLPHSCNECTTEFTAAAVLEVVYRVEWNTFRVELNGSYEPLYILLVMHSPVCLMTTETLHNLL